jgi:uncharacterized hydrophobic protein (TIGR00271 family)
MNNCLKIAIDMQNKYGIVQGLTLSLPGIIFIIIGSIIATFGLFYNAYPVVLGSMLISPIGNSIMRYCLGYVFNSSGFMTQGINSLMAQIVIGLVIGYIMETVNYHIGDKFNLPTEEMESRTSTKNFVTDFLIALLCGFILAYSIIHNQIFAIVGLSMVVAVLPPLVNTGVYISMAHHEHNIDKYNNNMTKAVRTFMLAMINIVGISFASIIGLYLFC